MADFIKKYGRPLWNYTITGHPAIQQNNFSHEGVVNLSGVNSAQTSSTAPVYFIPLSDTVTHEIKSYIYCAKIGDSSYKYKVYNKKSILNTNPPNPIITNNGIILLSVFAAFENTINGKKNESVPSPYAFNYSETSVSFIDSILTKVGVSKIAKNNNLSFGSSPNVQKLTDGDCIYIPHQTLISISIGNGTVFYLGVLYEENICNHNKRILGYFIPTNYGNGGSTTSNPGSSPSGPVIFGPGSVAGVYFGGGTNYSDPNLAGNGGIIPQGGPFDPFWQDPLSNGLSPVNGNLNSMYPELDNSIDASTALGYKSIYYSLEQMYYSRPPDSYTNMSRTDFITLLQNNPNLTASIDPVTILVKIGINAAADVLAQVFFIKLTDPVVNAWGDAFGKVDWFQVSATAASSLIPWHTSGGKALVAAINGAAVAISDLVSNGFVSWSKTGYKFVEGFGVSFIGNSIADVITKFGSVNNFGKALVTKLDNYFPYSTICRWMGGGVTYISKSYLNRIVNNGITIDLNISVKRVMQGWADKKIVIIGRSMEDRVKFFAQQLKNDLGNDYTIITFQVDPNWSPDQLFLENQKFINLLKNEGYTFYDLTLDDRFPISGNDLDDYGRYYWMEIMEIFNSK